MIMRRLRYLPQTRRTRLAYVPLQLTGRMAAAVLGHIAFQVDSADMVDSFVDSFLKPRQIEKLYGGAKAYPEYTPQYYAVYFEDPDRIKVEVVYEGGWEQPAVPAPDHDRESSVTASTEPPSGTSPPAATRSIPPGCGADCCR